MTHSPTSRPLVRIPESVAIIMDGNGRWATRKGLPRSVGHAAGADVLRERVRDAAEFGIRQLAVFSFSTENWTRPADEVSSLMSLFAQRLVDELPLLTEIGVRVRFVGSSAGLESELLDRMSQLEQRTADFQRIDLFVAFNYGARHEILDAAARYDGGGAEAFRALLYAPDLEDPKLLIRTGGERRISNFLLWQGAHTEFVFRDELWPDFDREAFESALAQYAGRVSVGRLAT